VKIFNFGDGSVSHCSRGHLTSSVVNVTMLLVRSFLNYSRSMLTIYWLFVS